ncbi:MAG: sugar ABC transporter permease [Ardenticatenales bacterium]|nr:sugar ABC transporter permease [Ardenticatenales bacterium]
MEDTYSPSTYKSRAARARTAQWLQGALLWQGTLGMVGLGAAIVLLREPLASIPDAIRYLLAFLVGAGGIGSLVALPLIQRLDHRGRIIALTVNYLGFLAALFYEFHLLGIYKGIDALANTFAQGLPYLGLVIVGWFITGLAERYPHQPQRAKQVEQIGYGLMVVFGVLALVAVGLVPGTVAVLTRLLSAPLPMGLAVATALLGLMSWFWWREETGLYFSATVAQTEMLNGYLLLSPNLLGFLIFFAGPLIFSLYVSFTDWSAFGDKEWVGLANYQKILSFDVATLESPTQRAREVLAARHIELTRFNVMGQDIVIGAQDKLFWIALRNTFMFCVLVVLLSVFPALILANILNSKIPGMKFFRAIYFLPSVAAVVGVAVIWNWLYNSTTGFINFGISNLVEMLNQLPGVALDDPRVTWLSNSDTALLAIVVMSAWRIVGFNTVLFLAGLQGISRDIYEAADVDGANDWRKFRSITIPLLAPTTFFVVTTTVIQALQIFDEVFVLMNPPAGPNNSTLTAVLYLYQNGFQRFEVGYASAVAWVLFLIIFIVTAIQFRVQRTGVDADSAY